MPGGGLCPRLSSRALLHCPQPCLLGRVLRAPEHPWGAQGAESQSRLAPCAQPLLSLTKVFLLARWEPLGKRRFCTAGKSPSPGGSPCWWVRRGRELGEERS